MATTKKDEKAAGATDAKPAEKAPEKPAAAPAAAAPAERPAAAAPAEKAGANGSSAPAAAAAKAEELKDKAAAAAAEARGRLKETYERFVQKITTELKERGKVGKQQWEDAVKAAREFVQKSKPELKREDLDKVTAGVRKDVRQALRTIKDRGEDFTRSESFLTARDKGAEFLLKLAAKVKDAAESVETNLTEVLKYRKGEVVGGGRFVCTSCSDTLALEESGPVPVCPKCGSEEFKRKT